MKLRRPFAAEEDTAQGARVVDIGVARRCESTPAIHEKTLHHILAASSGLTDGNFTGALAAEHAYVLRLKLATDVVQVDDVAARLVSCCPIATLVRVVPKATLKAQMRKAAGPLLVAQSTPVGCPARIDGALEAAACRLALEVGRVAKLRHHQRAEHRFFVAIVVRCDA